MTLLYIFMMISLEFPLIMLGAPKWIVSLPLLLFAALIILRIIGKNSTVFETYAHIVVYGYNIIKPILYVWAVIVAIQGEQDTLAIVLYVATALQVPSMIKKFIGTIGIIITSAFSRNRW